MRVVFMGTPHFAVPTLEKLTATHDVVLAVTRPDAIRSRGRTAEPSPVKVTALAHDIALIEAKRVTPEVISAVRAAIPDIIVVAAYGALLPDRLLALAPHGAINVHASLLPRWRGAAPIQRAVLAGDEAVGVSIMRIAHELDAGSYCRQAHIPARDRSAAELTESLATLGAQELVFALEDIAKNTATWTRQDEALVTYAPKITKAEMRLDPTDTAVVNVRRVRASTDAAPARLSVARKGLRILEAELAPEDATPAGTVTKVGRHVFLGCADDTTLELVRVRPDGRRDMDADAWAQGLRGDLSTWASV